MDQISKKELTQLIELFARSELAKSFNASGELPIETTIGREHLVTLGPLRSRSLRECQVSVGGRHLTLLADSRSGEIIVWRFPSHFSEGQKKGILTPKEAQNIAENAVDIPDDAILHEVRVIDRGSASPVFEVIWRREISGVPVWDDLIRVKINVATSKVISVLKHWSKPPALPDEPISNINELKTIAHQEICKQYGIPEEAYADLVEERYILHGTGEEQSRLKRGLVVRYCEEARGPGAWAIIALDRYGEVLLIDRSL